MVVPEDVPAAEVEAAVRAGGGDLLESLRVFDLYRGEQVGEGSKSLALRLEFRAPDRTLTDEEVAERRAGHRARDREAREGRCVSDAGAHAWPCSAPPASAARSARGSWTGTRRSS